MRIYGDSTSINDLISTAMEKLKTIVDSSTIVGEQIVTPGNDTIIPISKVTVGFVVGGGEYADLSARRVANHFPMSGGSSGGMSVSPVGFLILHENGDVDFVNVENKSLYQTVLNMFNSLLQKMEKNADSGCQNENCGCPHDASCMDEDEDANFGKEKGKNFSENNEEEDAENGEGDDDENAADDENAGALQNLEDELDDMQGKLLKKERKNLKREQKKQEKKLRKQERKHARHDEASDEDLSFANQIRFDEADDEE